MSSKAFCASMIEVVDGFDEHVQWHAMACLRCLLERRMDFEFPTEGLAG
jgi:hypothetical protein